MSNNIKEKEAKQISIWLPASFVEEFKEFVQELNDDSDRISKIPEREVVYLALKEYMNKYKKGGGDGRTESAKN